MVVYFDPRSARGSPGPSTIHIVKQLHSQVIAQVRPNDLVSNFRVAQRLSSFYENSIYKTHIFDF